MPIPFLIAGLGVAAGALGVMGHSEAKETNEKAESVSRKAQKLYEDAKDSLEIVQKETQETLLDLGYSKKNVLEGSIKEFLQVYDQIKNIRLSKTTGLNEIVNFAVEQKDVVELREMSNIYESALSNSAAGVATGAIIALAASGSLSIVTGTLSLAGTALAWGEIGLAASFAGSALAAGAALTPLAAVAAPVVFFTGISASIKADENLEKAETMYAEADAAAEKMKLAETLCGAIGERAKMFKDLLDELDEVFSECTEELSNMVRKKTGGSLTKTIDANTLTEKELELIGVTRSLAGAVKSIIDTPILNKEGNLTDESEKVYEKISGVLPEFVTFANEVNEINEVNEVNEDKDEALPEENSSGLGVRSCCDDILANVYKYDIGGKVEALVDNLQDEKSKLCDAIAELRKETNVSKDKFNAYISDIFASKSENRKERDKFKKLLVDKFGEAERKGRNMFEAGILGTLEDIGYSIRNAVKENTSTEKLLKEKKAQLASNEELTEEIKEQVLDFIRSMAECIDDFVQKVNKFESQEELYSYTELDYPEYMEYGSNEFEYPTKVKAKAACKTAVGFMVDAVKEKYEKQRDEIISCTRKYYLGLENKFNGFIDEFIETYDDYVAVECDDDKTREYVSSRKAELFGKESLEKEALEYNLRTKFHMLVNERFGASSTEIFNKRKYFTMCEYAEDEERYCYMMEAACNGIYEEANRSLMEEAEIFPENVFKEYIMAIVSFCEILKNKLAKL